MLIIDTIHPLYREDSCISVTVWRVIARRTDFILVFQITIMKPILESKLRRVEMCPLFCLVHLAYTDVLTQNCCFNPIMCKHLWSF